MHVRCQITALQSQCVRKAPWLVDEHISQNPVLDVTMNLCATVSPYDFHSSQILSFSKNRLLIMADKATPAGLSLLIFG